MGIKKYDEVSKNVKQIAINNFIGGITWGLGATIGLAIILAALTFVFKQINVIPLVGNFASQVSQYVQVKNGNSSK